MISRLVFVSALLLPVSLVFGQDAGLSRFRAQVNGLHAGDRILVQQGPEISSRAEITEVLAGGAYKVRLWDKADAPANDPEPWLLRQNEREVVLSKHEVEKLNGSVQPKGAYWLNTWLIDPTSDPVLAERIALAQKAVAEILPASELTLPADPAARKVRLAEIATLQKKLLDRIFKENPMRQPRRDPQALDRREALLKSKPELRGKIGAALASECGDSYDQSAALIAILHAIGPRAGLGAVALGGRTIGQLDAHEFIAVRLANGELGAFDPSWHDPLDPSVVENIDFATYDSRRGSNRNIHWISEAPAKLDRGFERGATSTGLTSVLGKTLEERVEEHADPIHVAER
jgi:hypothetical protein